MTTYIYPQSGKSRKAIQEITMDNASLCWACSACDSECPVFLGSEPFTSSKGFAHG